MKKHNAIVQYKRRSKYNAKRTNGYDSKAEAKHAMHLHLLQIAGEISDVRTQVRFPLSAAGRIIGHYVADFVYNDKTGKRHVVDVKGYETDMFKWKKKHFEAEYEIEIEIVK